VSSAEPTKPPSFHYDYFDDWALWVLDHGLPDLPDVLGEDDEVPIAYWAGPVFGTVLFRSWWTRGEEIPPFEGEDKEVNTDHYSYIRTHTGWEASGTGGGTAGPEADPMVPRPGLDHLTYFWSGWQEGPVGGVTGHVGVSARTIEVADSHGTNRKPVEAPLGVVVVCFDARDEVTIRVLDADDQLLAEAAPPSPQLW
jgi:hypothetical protein